MVFQVKIDGWRKGIRFSSAHATLDLGKCERLHGHSYALHCNVVGRQDARRIVMDFVEIVRALREIADELDHFVLIPTRNKRLKIDVTPEEVRMRNEGRDYKFPRGDCYLLPTESSTAEDLAGFILQQLLKRVKVPPSVARIELGCDEGYGQGAWVDWTRPRRTGS